MPKQLIYSDTRPYVRDGEGNEIYLGQDSSVLPTGPVLQRGVHVGWSKEASFVEIGCAEFEVATESNNESGLYLSLDRRGINDLIRALQRARDGAFGKDA